ncbi:MAG: hypothetical protein AABY64_10205 [Bdellovibrionota bacterium]
MGRGARPLSSKAPVHLVLKANKECLRGGFRTYRRYFLIQKFEQNDLLNLSLNQGTSKKVTDTPMLSG